MTMAQRERKREIETESETERQRETSSRSDRNLEAGFEWEKRMRAREERTWYTRSWRTNFTEIERAFF
jgi:hypothetical protein